MSGECGRCGEHCLECSCAMTTTPPTERARLIDDMALTYAIATDTVPDPKGIAAIADRTLSQTSEREAIVKWLREMDIFEGKGIPKAIADAIERGDHLPTAEQG